MKQIVYPILMIDDEPENIECLEEVLDAIETRMRINRRFKFADRIREFAGNPEEAAQLMAIAMKRKIKYSAIICDNHMKGDDGEGIDGDDFLRVVLGKLVYCFSRDENDLGESLERFGDFREIMDYAGRTDDELFDFLNCSFSDLTIYRNFVNYFSRVPTILLCGAPREANLAGLESAEVVQKKLEGSRRSARNGPCEREILDYLIDKGVLIEKYARAAIDEHCRLGIAVPITRAIYRSRDMRR